MQCSDLERRLFFLPKGSEKDFPWSSMLSFFVYLNSSNGLIQIKKNSVPFLPTSRVANFKKTGACKTSSHRKTPITIGTVTYY